MKHPVSELSKIGTEDDFFIDLNADIVQVAGRDAPFKIETEDYSVYWAGSVLRVDIKGITV